MSVKLPEGPTPANRTLDGISLLIYGPSKIGKSTFASQFDAPIFLALEPGLRALSVAQIPIHTWDEFLDACALLANEKHPYKTIVVDTLDIMYRLCADDVCAKKRVQHESELEYGRGYGLIKNELYRVLVKLAGLPQTLVLISHSQTRDTDSKSGHRNRFVPTLPESMRQIVIGLVDVILFANTNVHGERMLYCQSSPMHDGGDRFGVLPDKIPLDYITFHNSFSENKPKIDKKEQQ